MPANEVEAWEEGRLQHGLALVAASAAVAFLLIVAGRVAMEWPWMPAAAVLAVLLAAWCSQRPSRWVYILIAAIFLESCTFSLYVGGARLRPAQFVLLPALATLALGTATGRTHIPRIPLLAPLVFYLACSLLSTLLGPVPGQSLKIFLLMASLVALYIVTYVLLRDDPAIWPSMFRFFMLVGLLEIGFGLYQVAAGLANAQLGWHLPIGALGLAHADYLGTVFGRPYGSMPEPDTYGAVCLFFALMLGLMWLTAAVRPRSRLVLSTAAIAVAGLLIGFVRASWFGLLVGVFWALQLHVRRQLRPICWLRVNGALGLAMVVVLVALAVSPPLRDVVARRLARGGDAPEQSLSPANARFRQMAAAIQLWRERPLLGNGPGSFSALGRMGAHQEYYLDLETFDVRAIYDPSILTTVLNDTGLLGIAAFVLLVGAYFRRVRRQTVRLKDRHARHRALAAHCALVGLGASFLFTHFLWLPFFWLLLAMTLLLFEPVIAGTTHRAGPS
jgi:O-antigen ligase